MLVKDLITLTNKGSPRDKQAQTNTLIEGHKFQEKTGHDGKITSGPTNIWTKHCPIP